MCVCVWFGGLEPGWFAISECVCEQLRINVIVSQSLYEKSNSSEGCCLLKHPCKESRIRARVIHTEIKSHCRPVLSHVEADTDGNTIPEFGYRSINMFLYKVLLVTSQSSVLNAVLTQSAV